MSFDYTTVGHVTVDVLGDGTRRPGGSAFYSALQAARLGQRTLILTRGAPGEIAELWSRIAASSSSKSCPPPGRRRFRPSAAARRTASGCCRGRDRSTQHVVLDTAILHLAPVARETPASVAGTGRLRGAHAAGARAGVGRGGRGRAPCGRLTRTASPRQLRRGRVERARARMLRGADLRRDTGGGDRRGHGGCGRDDAAAAGRSNRSGGRARDGESA